MIGKNFIHVYHLKPLADIEENYIINPIKDLIPICPNRHSMIHRNKNLFSKDELIEIIRNVEIKKAEA